MRWQDNPLKGRAKLYRTPPADTPWDVDNTARPKWNEEDMDYWLNDNLTIMSNPYYKAVPYDHGNWTESGVIDNK